VPIFNLHEIENGPIVYNVEEKKWYSYSLVNLIGAFDQAVCNPELLPVSSLEKANEIFISISRAP
jgi:hypothetical protein